LSTNPNEEILPCREISVAPEICRGGNFCTGYPRKNPVLWINFRGTGKNPGIRLELGKADGFPEKVNCRGYSRWSEGSTGAGEFLDPILDPIQESHAAW